MTGRAVALVEKTEASLLLRPEWHKKIAVTLLNLVRIRFDPTYEQGLDLLVSTARQMQKDSALEIEAEILLSEAEIASDFPKLTRPEADDLEKYFLNLLMKPGDSLANHLSTSLNGKISDYWNVRNFSDEKSKMFAFERSLINADDPDREEDFCLELEKEISHEKIFRLIENYYIDYGFKIRKEEVFPHVIAADRDSKQVLVVVTEMDRKILITVNVIDMS